MGVDLEVWRARIGLYRGGRGSRFRKALRAYRRLFTGDVVTWATGETTNCAIQTILVGFSIWLILRFLCCRFNKFISTHPTKSNGGAHYHWSKDTKAPVSISVGIALVAVAIVLVLHSLAGLLIMAGDVELNPGPLTDVLKRADLCEIHSKLFDARTHWYNLGMALGVDPETLCSIEKRYSDHNVCLRELLDDRLKKGGHLTWSELCLCLRSGSVGRVDVAEKIEEDLKAPKHDTSMPDEHEGGSHRENVKAGRKRMILGAGNELCELSSVFPCKKFKPGPTSNPSTLAANAGHTDHNCHLMKHSGIVSHDKPSEEPNITSWAIQIAFNDLCVALRTSLEERNISTPKVIVCLMGFSAIRKVYKEQEDDYRYFHHELPNLRKAENILDIWLIIGEYCSFFSYGLVKVIAQHLGTQNDKDEVEGYEVKFNTYAKQRVADSLPADLDVNKENKTEIIVKFNCDYENVEIEHLKGLEEKLSRVIFAEIGDYLLLCKVRVGSLELTFLTPSFVETTAFPLSTEQETALKELGVVELRCGDYTYPSKNLLRVSSVSESDHHDEEPPSFSASIHTHSNARAMFSSAASDMEGHSTNASSPERSRATSISSVQVYTQTESSNKHKKAKSMSHFQINSHFAKKTAPHSISEKSLLKRRSSCSSYHSYKSTRHTQTDLLSDINELKSESSSDVSLEDHLSEHMKLPPDNEDDESNFLLQRLMRPEQSVDSQVNQKLPPDNEGDENCRVQMLRLNGQEKLIENLYTIAIKQTKAEEAKKSDSNLKFLPPDMKKSKVSRKVNYTPLHVAAFQGNLVNTKFLLEVIKCNPLDANKEGYTALHVAAEAGRLAIVEYLVEEFNINPAISSRAGTTPLHVASLNGHLELVKYFIDGQNVDPLCEDIYWMTPLNNACINGNPEIVEYIINEAKKHQPIESFIFNITSSGDTLLHSAASSNSIEVVHYLIQKYQLDPNAVSYSGSTPLHCAALNGHLEVLKFFIEQLKCDPHSRKTDRAMPIHLACERGHLNIVRYLLEECGCDKSAVNNNGLTPLHYAALNGHLDIVKFFIEQLKCDPNS